MSVNKVIIVGHLGRDPESRTFDNGNAVCNFSVATSEKWKDKHTGEMREATEWHRIQTSGKLAEICQQWLKKGSLVYIEGSLRTRKWEDKDGQERSVQEVRADVMKMLGAKNTGSESSAGQAEKRSPAPARQNTQQSQSPATSHSGSSGFDDMDDDIPF